jgi:hypothetical protein
LASSVEIPVNRNTACFDLVVGKTASIQSLHSKFTEIEKVARLAKTRVGPFLHLSKFCPLGHQRHKSA